MGTGVLTRHRAATNPCSGSGSALQGCVCPGAAKTRLFIRTSRGDGIISVAPVSARQRGFTLIEVLVATALLAAGLALAFATVRAATATAQRGEQLSQRSERMRAVEGFLRRRIASALPIGFETLPDTGEQIRFIGESTRMRFVADLPDYLGRGGPHLHDVELFDDGDAGRLAVSFTMVAGAQLLPERRPRPPETLAANLSGVRFRYRGLDEENAIGEWQDEWESPGQLPLQVSIEIADADGRKWPPLVVALPQAGAGSGGLFQ
jgi:general secretion pathway protein J